MPEPPRLQRRFPRVPSENAVLVKKIGDDSSEALAKTRVLGGGGCMFVHGVPLGVGSTVEMLISMPRQVLRVRARVVYELPARPGGVEVGVEFVDVAEGDREVLAAWLAGRADAVPS